MSLEQRWTALRAYIYPVAARIAHLFGFQKEHTHRGHTVPSNLDNEVDHVCKLVLNLMGRQGSLAVVCSALGPKVVCSGLQGSLAWSKALQHAVSTLHEQASLVNCLLIASADCL
jgi:hypothetical protein